MMFWKKKDKDDGASEAPEAQAPQPAPAPPAAPPQPVAPPPQMRQPEPPPQPVAPPPQPQMQAPPQPAPQPAPMPQQAPQAAPQSAPAGGDIVSRVSAVLEARLPAGTPPLSENSSLRRARDRAILELSSDPAGRQIAERMAGGDLDGALSTLEQNAGNPAFVRALGTLTFEIDPNRSRQAFESAHQMDARDFWTGVFLARLRGLAGQIDGARQVALGALDAAIDDQQRCHARTELALISFATNNVLAARGHAMEAVAAARGALTVKPGLESERDLAARLVLLGDAFVSNGELVEARAAYDEALRLVQGHIQANTAELANHRMAAEILMKLSPVAFRGGDSAQALQQAEQAAATMRNVVNARGDIGDLRTASATFAALGDLKRALKDQTGAFAAWDEALAALRKLVSMRPNERVLHRDLWTFMWRMATENHPNIGWAQVAQTIEASAQYGGLDASDQNVLAEAKRRAGQQ